MKRISGLGNRAVRAGGKAPWKTVWLVLVLGGQLLLGCSSSSPAPTLVPTLSLPTLAPTPSPAPTIGRFTPTPFATNFPTWRTVTIEAAQSFDFRQETLGFPTEGDLYYAAFNSRQGTACFWANNTNQVGGRDLGAWPLNALSTQPLPRDRYSGQCIPVIERHVYVYGLQGDRRLVVFRVATAGPDAVTIDYVLRE